MYILKKIMTMIGFLIGKTIVNIDIIQIKQIKTEMVDEICVVMMMEIENRDIMTTVLMSIIQIRQI